MTNQGMRGALSAARFAAAVLFVAACSNKASGPGEELTGTVIPGASSGMPAAGASAAGADSQAPTDPGSVGNAAGAMPMMMMPDQSPAMTGDVTGQPAEMGGSGDQAGAPSMASAGRGGGGSGGRSAPDAAVPDAGGTDDDVMPDAGAPDAGWSEPDDDDEAERGL